MKLPNADRAIIEEARLRDDLLSPSHPIGRHKARVFRRLGSSQELWQQLESDLRAQHLSQDVQRGETSPYGQKFEIRAMLNGPAGHREVLVSVWIIKTGEERPRLVTVKPGGPT